MRKPIVRPCGVPGWPWVGVFLMIAGPVWGRSKKAKADDFPDYNHIEYAKPLPPPDQQVPQSRPGSINMEVGGKKSRGEAEPAQAAPYPLSNPAKVSDDGEPPLTGLFDEAHPVESSSTLQSSGTLQDKSLDPPPEAEPPKK